MVNIEISERYDLKPASALIRGQSIRTGVPKIEDRLLEKSLDELTEEEMSEILRIGAEAGIKLYPFKNGKEELARVHRVIGFLHGIDFETLLDVGSGRGVFLLPFMNEFPDIKITSLDLLEKRVLFLNDLSRGGYKNLTAFQKDICGGNDNITEEKSFDVVTMLEVLEHIPNVEKAVEVAVKSAKKYVVVTVPSKPDDNPEHIHLLTKDKLTEMFTSAGCTKLHFGGVPGHLFLVASV